MAFSHGNPAIGDEKTNNTLQEAVGCHSESSLVLRKFRQNQKLSDLLLHHNQTPPRHHHRRTELLSKLRPGGGEHVGHGNEPVMKEKQHM